MPNLAIHHEIPPDEKIMKEIGDLSGVEIFNNQVLVALYLRPNVAIIGGKAFHLSDKTTDEDKFQSKVGLIVKMGPDAFRDEKNQWFTGLEFNVGDWLVFRASDGWKLEVNKVLCKVLEDIDIKGRVSHPDLVY